MFLISNWRVWSLTINIDFLESQITSQGCVHVCVCVCIYVCCLFFPWLHVECLKILDILLEEWKQKKPKASRLIAFLIGAIKKNALERECLI